jgi:signal peptidase II
LNKKLLVGIIIIGVLFLDQFVKFWIKLHFNYGEEVSILGLNWARLHFVENAGMAFGFEFGGKMGKLFLTIFRIFVAGGILYVIYDLIRTKASTLSLVCLSLIFAGAVGNIIDSIIYGVIFSESPYHGGIAQLLPKEGGYGTFLHGKVVDMFYFPMIDSTWPQWLPFLGGKAFRFFDPVFNVADASISVGIFLFLLIQVKIGDKPKSNSDTIAEAVTD